MRALPLLFLLACGGDPVGPSPTTTDSTLDSGTTDTTSTTTVTGVTGEVGDVTFWNFGARHSVQVYASSSFDGLPVPAICALGGELCIDALPTVPDVATDWVDGSYDPDVSGVTWLGNEIMVGPMPVNFRVIPETGFGGYSLPVPGVPPEALDLVIDGEWGPFTATAAINPPPPMEGTFPGNGGYIDLAEEVTFTWVPGDGDLYMEVELAVNGIHEMWLLTDDGTHTIPSTHFGALGTSDIVTITLYRINPLEEFDVNGNLLSVKAIDKTQFSTGNAQPPTCKHHFDADPNAVSGEYFIAPNPAEPPVAVWCDMTTDGGGWTLVASTNTTMNDEAVNYNNNLTTLSPTSNMTGIWDALRAPIPGNSDIRFACKLNGNDANMTVDLSYYANNWYREITNGTDNDSCFNENTGIGATFPPERRNNLNGDTRASGDLWDANGYLEGEDSCGDQSDFTVDFDDRGMDSNQSDGTDWGEDDGSGKCGITGTTGVWFIFVR